MFDSEWWKGKWDNVVTWGKEAMGGIGGWVSGLIEDTKERFGAGREKGKESAKKTKTKPPAPTITPTLYNSQNALEYADGGIITKPHLGLVGEAGPEMIIPLSSGRRGRAMDLYNQTGEMLGVKPYASGGLAGGMVKTATQGATVQASVDINQVNAGSIEKEAALYGEKFSNSVGDGINQKVISLDKWKNRNIQQPMNNVIDEAVGFGSNTVNSFATGQNATRTYTDRHLNNQVKDPFELIEGRSPKWGSGTVVGFRAGQNAMQTGTKPYLVSNVHNPFDDTKARGSGWGSGVASEFVPGMRSEGAKVKEAAEYLAEQVEKTFKSELGIKSPSRVMMSLGKFASLGIVKGLGDVDIKKFAEKQAGSLAAAFSGMGNIGGNVSEWIGVAMVISGSNESCIGVLSTLYVNMLCTSKQ